MGLTLRPTATVLIQKATNQNAQPVQENEKKTKQKNKILYARILAVLSLDPSGNAGMKENGHPHTNE